MNPEAATPPTNDGDTRTPAIYVASLADYNAGRLHGAWMSADQEPDELLIATESMLAASPEAVAEEWAIHDYENFAGVQIGEFARFATVAHLACGIRTYGPAFAIFANYVGHDEADYASFEASYAGLWEDPKDYVCERLQVEELEVRIASIVPPELQAYVSFNVAGFLHDLKLNGDVYVVATYDGSHVFERP